MASKIYTRNHQVELARWNPDPRVLARIEGSGFEYVHMMSFLMRTDLNLFIALVHFYSVEVRCFIFEDRRIVPTLDDVLRIMGFRVDGRPVTGRDYGKKMCEELCLELLDSEKYATGRTGSQISWRKLIYLEVVHIDVDGEGVDVYMRGYILHCIGCLVCPSMNPATIPSMFLGLLRNVDEVKDGGAFLAQSMNQVHLFNLNIDKATTNAASVPFFMVFCLNM